NKALLPFRSAPSRSYFNPFLPLRIAYSVWLRRNAQGRAEFGLVAPKCAWSRRVRFGRAEMRMVAPNSVWSRAGCAACTHPNPLRGVPPDFLRTLRGVRPHGFQFERLVPLLAFPRRVGLPQYQRIYHQ